MDQDKVYQKRRELTLKLAKSLQLIPKEISGGLFVWCQLPEGDQDDKAFVDQLLHEKHIFIAPGSVFGKNGEGYVRFSICVTEDDISTMLDRVSKKAEA
jgi:aspartate/methionine/tyrosine aminotransferase